MWSSFWGPLYKALVVMQALVEETVVGLAPTLVMTLPTNAADALVEIELWPTLGDTSLDTVTPLPGGAPNVLAYELPPLLPGRGLVASVTGPAGARDGLDGLQIDLTYSQSGRRLQQQRILQPVGRNRLGITISEPIEGSVLRGAANVTGITRGQPGATAVYVCVTADTACADNQYTQANGVERWSFPFTPTEDGTYRIFAYAENDLGHRSAPADPLSVHVDTTPPTGLSIDLTDGMALSTTTTLEGLPALVLPVSAVDSGSYSSGLTHITISDGRGRSESLEIPAARRGDASFALRWPLPGVSRGDSATTLSSQPLSLTLTAVDEAGNAATTTMPVHLLVDDVPPALEATLPRVVDGNQLRVSGHADDLRYEPGAYRPYSNTQTTADATTSVNLGSADSFATIIGDMNGDRLHEVLLLQPATSTTPLQAGLFFGTPSLPANLALADADVRFTGEAATISAYAPIAADAGDVNGDGLNDLLISDPGARRGAGNVYLVLGRPTNDWFSPFALIDADEVFTPAGVTAFGANLAGLGDTDGDGLADYLLAAADTGAGRGGVWLALGHSENAPPPIVGPWETALVPACEDCTALLPPTLAGPGDVDGDGLADMLVGYPQTVSLIPGRERGDWPTESQAIAGVAQTNFAVPGEFVNVSALGDANGDGLMDMLMADPDSSPARVFVVNGRRQPWPLTEGKVDLLSQAERVYEESSLVDSRLGVGLTPLGDVDGDWLADFALGQPGRGAGPNRILLALSGLARGQRVHEAGESTQIIATSRGDANLLGRSLSRGQVNGDGVVDLLVLAPRGASAYLFQPERGVVHAAGLNRVEIGVVGPLADAELSPEKIQPSDWTMVQWNLATQSNVRPCQSCWEGTLNLPNPGTYYVYARALDVAGNWSPGASWFQGAVLVTGQSGSGQGRAGASFDLSLDSPAVVDGRFISATVSIGDLSGISDWRYFDGRRWHELPLVSSRQPVSTPLPLLDGHAVTLRLAARSADGVSEQISMTLPVDNQPPLLLPTANLTERTWHTDLTPTLVVTWPEVSDRSGITGVWAVIDTHPDTVPTAAVGNNRVRRVLDQPGAYYAHILAEDNAGNRSLRHLGPFGVNRSRTPSAVGVDGILDLAGGEYPASSLVSVDPLSDFGEGALWGTWDDDALYLAHSEAGWNPNRRFFIYLNTTSGGLNSSLPAFSATQTLPFDADHLLVLGAETLAGFAVYTAGVGNWRNESASGWQVAQGFNTEIRIDRDVVGDRGSVEILAYVLDERGIQQVYPPTARPVNRTERAANVTLRRSLSWSTLDDNVEPRLGQDQLTTPEFVISGGREDRLYEGQIVDFTVAMTRPHSRLERQPDLILQSSPELLLIGVDGVECLDCPANGNRWRLATDLAPGESRRFSVKARVADALPAGSRPVSVTLGLAGDFGELGAAGVHHWVVDASVGELAFFDPDQTVYVSPGPFQTGFDLLGDLLSCGTGIEVNTGGGWGVLCEAGNCTSITGDMAGNASVLLQARLRNSSRSSPTAQITLVADNIAPSAILSPTQVIAAARPFLQGTSSDDFPADGIPQRVQVSLNGGPFVSAQIAPSTSLSSRASRTTKAGDWYLPVQLGAIDGESVDVAVRAVDEAGNIGRATTTNILVDTVGPTLQAIQEENALVIAAQDGSGVTQVDVSLDGGVTYISASIRGSIWQFDLPLHSSTPALIRAADRWGNQSRTAISIERTLTPPTQIYLPTIQQSSSATRVGEEYVHSIYLPTIQRGE